MVRYHVTANTVVYADFWDSADAHRYARNLSKRLPQSTVAVDRVNVLNGVAIKDGFPSTVTYYAGKQSI